MDIVTFALAKKLAAGAVSGVSSMSVSGLTLTINCVNGQVLTMTFPEPDDGVSVADVQIAVIEEVPHLICTMSDNSVIDAGEIPTTEGFSPSASVTETPTGVVISITDKNGTTTAELSNSGTESLTSEQLNALLTLLD